MRFLAAMLALLVFGTVALSDTYYDGYVDGSYTYRGGYWYYGSQAYTRTLYQNPGYWTYGCYGRSYYPGSYYYSYTPYYAPAAPAYTPPSPPAYSTNWKTEMVKYAESLDDSAAYLQALSVLGLHGQARSFQQGGLAYSGGLYGAGYGANANTQYGYSYNTIASLYGDTNINGLYQQAAQLTSDAQALGGQANAAFQTTLAQDTTARARVAEVIARGQMTAQIINALQAAPSATVATQGYKFSLGSNGQMQRDDTNVSPETKAEVYKAWQQSAQARCAACHSGGKAKGGFDIAAYPKLTPQQKQIVWGRLTTDDQAKMMPRDTADPTKPGQRLSPEEQRLWYLN